MTILASPTKAFLPALWSSSAVRRVHLASSAPVSSTLRHHLKSKVARQTNTPQTSSRRSLVSLFAATDGAKDAAMAAVQAAEEALNRAAEEAGAPAVAGEVQVTVAAARAAARNAMESLRRDEMGLSGEGGRDVLTPRQVGCVLVDPDGCGTFVTFRGGAFVVASCRSRQGTLYSSCCAVSGAKHSYTFVALHENPGGQRWNQTRCTALADIGIDQDLVTSPARSAVQAALAAIAEAQTATSAGATAESSAAAQDAIGMVQAALDRRDSAAAELGAVSSDDSPGAVTPNSASPRDTSSGAAEGGPSDGSDGSDQEDPTKEPESAHWSRNNPAASHSHMAHLLW